MNVTLIPCIEIDRFLDDDTEISIRNAVDEYFDDDIGILDIDYVNGTTYITLDVPSDMITYSDKIIDIVEQINELCSY